MITILLLIIFFETIAVIALSKECNYWKQVVKFQKDTMKKMWNEEGKEGKE